MSEENSSISDAFKAFLEHAPLHAKAWGAMVQELSAASTLDAKTKTLAYLAVLAATGATTGIPFHAQTAKSLGIPLEDVVSAILVGLPAAGHGVTQALPPAISTYNGS